MKMRRHKLRQARLSYTTICCGVHPQWQWNHWATEGAIEAFQGLSRALTRLQEQISAYVEKHYPERV